MATLRSVFKLTDKYTNTINKIDRATSKATGNIIEASDSTDKFNKKLDATGASASTASGGLKKLIGAVISLAAAKKGMDIADEFMNTSARLNLINDGLQTQAELQDKIFASAKRARGEYTEMASAISKMGLLAGDAFTSNDELIAFTELVQKSFKVGGADTSEQQGAMRQLSQAMASGRLQGDELVSIMENAPMIYNAISKYMGLTKGELKELSSDGAITADIIKKAMFMAGEDINEMFESMPRTFGDVWTDIKNGALKAFQPIIVKANELINTDKFESFTNGIIGGLSTIADLALWALEGLVNIYNFINTNWDKLAPVVYSLAAALLTVKTALLAVKTATWLVNVAMALNPIGLVIVLVVGLVAAFVYLWETSEGFREFMTDFWASGMMRTAKFYNFFVDVVNKLVEAQNYLADGFIEFDGKVRNVWLSVVKTVANGAKAIVSSFDFITDGLNKTVGLYNKAASAMGGDTIDIDFTAKGINNTIDAKVSEYEKSLLGAGNRLTNKITDSKASPLASIDMDNYTKAVDFFSSKAKDFTITDFVSGAVKDMKGKLGLDMADVPYDLSGFSNGAEGLGETPIKVKGTGKNDSLKVSMEDEDLRYLRDVAERDYINKFSTSTLAPNIKIEFGDVHEEADANKVAGRIKAILQEEIAMVAEGSH